MEEQGQNDPSERLVLSTNDYLDDNWLIQRVGRTAAGKQTADPRCNKVRHHKLYVGNVYDEYHNTDNRRMQNLIDDFRTRVEGKGAGDHLRRSSSRPGRGDPRVIDKDQTGCGVPAGYDVLNDSDGGPDEIRCPLVTSDQSDTEDDNDDDNGHDNSYGNDEGNDEQFGRAPLGRTRRMEECDDDDGNGDGNDDVVAVEVRPASGTSPADSSEGVSVAKPPPTATLNMPSSLSGTKQPGNPGYLPSRTSTSTCGGAPDAMSPSGAYAGRTSGSCNGERPKQHAVGTPGGKVATKGGRNAKGKKEGKGKGKGAASTAGGGKATPGRRTVTPEERKKMKEMAGRISEAAQAEHDRAYRSWADKTSRPSTYGTSGMDPFTATAAKRVKAAWTGAGGSSAFGTQGHGKETAYEIAGSPRTNAVEQSRIDQNTPGNPSDISAKVAESLRTLQSHAPDLLSPMEGGNTRRRQSPMERANPDPAKGLGSGGGPDRPNGFDGQSGPVGSPVGYGDAAGLDKSRCRALETGGEDRHPGRTPASWSSLHERANWTDDGRSLKPAVASPALPYPRARDAMYQYNDEYRFDEYGRPGWTHDADGFDRRGFNRSGVNVRGFDITGRRPDPARSEFSGQHGIRDVEGHATTRKRDHFASLSGGALPVVGSAVDGPWSGATPLVAGGKSEACSGAGQPSGEEEDVPLREFRRLTAEVKPYRFATRDTLRAWKQAYDLLKKTRHVLGRPGITAILNGRGKADPLVLGCSRQTADRWADASVAIDVCHDEKCCAADANVADRLQRHPVIPRAKKG